MERIPIQDYQVLVLAEGETVAAASNAKGHLFEAFIAKMLNAFGFDDPHESDVNVTSEGIELDILVKNSLTNASAVAECKAYSTNVRAQALTSFVGKLQMERYDDPDIDGFMVTLPRLVADGEEKARKAEERDKKFHYINAERLVAHLISRHLVRQPDAVIPDGLIVSDPAIVISEDGLYACVKVLDPLSRRAQNVVVWGAKASAVIPYSPLELLRASEYGADLVVQSIDAASSATVISTGIPHSDTAPPLVVTVRGSASDFEYQFPASPQFFVGRRTIVQELNKVIESPGGTFVLNAQSGWGKSSLALKFQLMVKTAGGYAIVIDSRTASSPAFVTETLRIAAQRAAEDGIFRLPDDCSWASVQSAVATLDNATWKDGAPLAIFFDQFENVFQDEATTRQFRDLALVIQESKRRIIVGFAWKTDLVGWTESHPYRLRDEIRAASRHIIVEPMGAKDIETLLRRLEKRVGQSLARELRQRLREYSQGLPWLFKKLAEHIIREIEDHGKTQEQLVSEALNIQSLFDSDLAGLQPLEQDAVRHVARYAPVAAAEVIERYDGPVVQSLLDRRLIVAVGEKLDTYWDTFRDFLNTGQIPVEDSYTIGLTPQSAAPVISRVIASGGSMSPSDVAATLGVTLKSIGNVSRILRLLGITTYEASAIHIIDSVMEAADRNGALRRTVATTLKRHKAFSIFNSLSERHSERVPLETFARELSQAFPAVDAQHKTWVIYGRAFAAWFEYAGLAVFKDNELCLPGDDFVGLGSLLSSAAKVPTRASGYLQGAPGPAQRLLLRISEFDLRNQDLNRGEQRAMHDLLLLGFVNVKSDAILGAAGSLESGAMSKSFLGAALRRLPALSSALDLLDRDPAADNKALGECIRGAIGADWRDSTTELSGKQFRSWAKAAGFVSERARFRARRSDPTEA